MSYWWWCWSWEDNVRDEIDIEDNRDGGDNIEEEEKGHEVSIDENDAEEYFDDEDCHDDETDTIENNVDSLIEESCSEIIWKQRIQGQDRNKYLILETE